MHCRVHGDWNSAREIGCPNCVIELRNENKALAARLAEAERLCAAQAEDEGLWFHARTVGEAMLQEALRRVHHAVEGTR